MTDEVPYLGIKEDWKQGKIQGTGKRNGGEKERRPGNSNVE